MTATYRFTFGCAWLIDGKGRCSKCDHKFVPGDPALAMRPHQADRRLGGENRESNMQILLRGVPQEENWR